MDEFNTFDESGEETATSSFKQIQRLMKNTFKLVGSFFKVIGSFLLSSWWIILIIVIIVSVISAVTGVASYLFSGGFNKETGTMVSLGGVKTDKFYGTRYIYYDEEYTTNDLANQYLDFTYKILLEFKGNDETKLNIDFTKSYNENNQIKNLTTSYAQKLLNPESPNLSLSLTDCTKQIDHYGFDETNEVNIVLDKLATDLTNGINGGNAYTALDKEQVYTQLDNIFNSSFLYMKNICAKILIKDYLTNEESLQISKKNYLGFVYMPKEEISIKSTNFIFLIDENNTVEIKANVKSESEVIEIDSTVADSTWFKDGTMDKALNLNLSEYNLNSFTAIDDDNLNYLKDGKSLFDICKDNKIETYFKLGVDLKNYISILENFNSNNYFYLKLNSSAPYNMADVVVDY